MKFWQRLLETVDDLIQYPYNPSYVCANFSCPDSMSSHIPKIILHTILAMRWPYMDIVAG